MARLIVGVKRQVPRFARLGAALVAAAMIALTAGPALAQWTSQLIADPDGRGQPVLLQGPSGDGKRYLQFWCRGDLRRVSVLSYDGLGSPLQNGQTGVVVEIRPDGGGVWSSGGDLYRHEQGWAGLSYRNVHEMRALAEAIVAARSEIVVNIVDLGGGQTQTATFSAKELDRRRPRLSRQMLRRRRGAGTAGPAPAARPRLPTVRRRRRRTPAASRGRWRGNPTPSTAACACG